MLRLPNCAALGSGKPLLIESPPLTPPLPISVEVTRVGDAHADRRVGNAKKLCYSRRVSYCTGDSITDVWFD